MTTTIKPMAALKTSYCLSNSEAALVLDMVHDNLHGEVTAEACVDVFGPQGAYHQKKQAKVLTAYRAFLAMGKDEFWADAFKRAAEIKADTAHIHIPTNSGGDLKGWTKADDYTQ